MSYALDLTVRARRGFMALPVAAQELVLDALDKISADPELLVERLPLFPDALYDDDFFVGGARYYIFIVAQRDRVRETIRVKRIHHLVRLK